MISEQTKEYYQLGKKNDVCESTKKTASAILLGQEFVDYVQQG